MFFIVIWFDADNTLCKQFLSTFYPLWVVGRGSETQLRVGKNICVTQLFKG